MLISTITSNIPFIQLSLMHRITEKICKERWQHWCTKISGVKVLPTLLISTITSNMSFIQLSLMLSGYPASSVHFLCSPPKITDGSNLTRIFCRMGWNHQVAKFEKEEQKFPRHDTPSSAAHRAAMYGWPSPEGLLIAQTPWVFWGLGSIWLLAM